jgi:tetratricopeptide (TPR) repeat protein
MHGRGTQAQRELQRRVKKAQELMDGQDFDEARLLLLELRRDCQRQGVRTAQVPWMLAIVGDYTRDADMAVQFIQEALQTDPLSVPVLRSFDIISGHLKGELTSAERPADAEDTPRLYALLQQLGEADVPCHLAMARHEAHAGQLAEALHRLEAVVLLAPFAREAWALKAEVAGKLGDAAAAQRAALEAAALGGDAPLRPFGVPGRAEG